MSSLSDPVFALFLQTAQPIHAFRPLAHRCFIPSLPGRFPVCVYACMRVCASCLWCCKSYNIGR